MLPASDRELSRLWRRAAVQTGTVTVAVHLTGWGPALACAYVGLLAVGARRDGAGAVRPLLVTALAGLAAGQVAVAAGVVPSRMSPGTSHLVAVLAATVLLQVFVLIRSSASRLEEQQRAVTERLHAVDRARSEFLALVSHELRSPVTAMLGAARTIQLRGAELTPDVHDELLDSVVRRGDELRSLVEDLVHASGALAVRKAALDLCALARSAASDARVVHPGLEVDVHCPTGALAVAADPVRIRQVLDNLMANAAKYGGAHATVGVQQAGRWAVVTVADRGEGMTAEQARRAFDAFYQADSSDSRRSGGLGLGLYICRRIVEAHGGQIEIDVRGGGTCVVVRLPLA